MTFPTISGSDYQNPEFYWKQGNNGGDSIGGPKECVIHKY